MHLKSTLAGALMATASVAVALAQQPTASTGTVITSEPGRASVVRTEQASAEVVRIDKATRTVTLKGAQGDTIEIVAGDQVKNFDQIKLGDIVVARYTKALSLKLKKTKGPPDDVSVSEGSSQAKPGEEPSFTGARQITAIAEVVAVDPKESTIKLKGPQGRVVTLDVNNPDQFKVVKEGDQVEVTYTEAVALSVEPASK
jgi:hypothetical protein